MRLDEISSNRFSIGKVLSYPELINTVKSDLDKHGVGWKMSKRSDNTFLFSAENDFGSYSMLILESTGDGFFDFGHGIVFPDQTTENIEGGELPMTAASASEVSQRAVSLYHDVDLSEFDDDDDSY